MASLRSALIGLLLLLILSSPGTVYNLPKASAEYFPPSLGLSSTIISLIQSSETGASRPPTGLVPAEATSFEIERSHLSQPLLTKTATPPRTTLLATGTLAISTSTVDSEATMVNPQIIFGTHSQPIDVFQAIATTPPPSQITPRGDHPAPRLGIAPQRNPLSTNKFYANLFLGGQGQGAWTHPYSIAWSKGSGNAQSWGMSVSQIDAYQRAYGPPNNALPRSPVQYFINPVGIQSVILSAAELGTSTVLTTDSLQASSVNAYLRTQTGSNSSIQFPLVQGMGFVTGIYTKLQPVVQSSVFFRNVVSSGCPRTGVYKYIATLEDGNQWLIYAVPSNGQNPGFNLKLNTLLQGPARWSGIIQVAKNPAGTAGEAIFDRSAGVYATTANVTGFVRGKTGDYCVRWTKAGISSDQPLLMFALPHHLSSFDSHTAAALTQVSLTTTTKGIATAVLADSWTMVEHDLPIDMGFAPWSPSSGKRVKISNKSISTIGKIASSEVKQDMSAQSNLNSMYFAGKALSKFAAIIYTIKDITNNTQLAQEGLAQLKTAYARFASNKQMFPLVYDTAWGGIVSSASYPYQTNDSGADFGNTYYNDHHFHYGYFIHAAAIIGYLDSTWLAANKDWVNALVRDVANPSKSDNYFPVSRSFDWYHGHSWAKGLFESADSKDEESSSEDAMFAYGMKMWGHVTGDTSMEARGNLMLSILARTLRHYFLLESGNKVQPASFIGNKVTGILFDNKIDHTTYFGSNIEYIQGIHMIPLLPFSTLTRTKNFVAEEWNTYFAQNGTDPASKVVGGWKGILYANLAIIDPKVSFEFFSSSHFDASWLDGGASQTWYLAFAAGLGDL